ncbi:2-oxo-4-hydroxy-4-carboxy-5-ureidoimidazoline decarboxylase [Metapseudomonas resinovorans]|uniref:2-oxo-4-hydroxy-4-carboxy-5-ureidoimidazoline decarboxylase n=1 Tax=Metapseudomonas resinovorans NBRC 106553 TaxID=1245471 RepID=S6AXG8_METRE|nr:2-oxo-4-hydroxy-4-carboxy-5-ureidoimidazoline decarboxylase [Pseudomonas resinovorans]BAN49351.1 hypothetical protein PCA10_36190 [Pseudomonas resinovorans NBRC 106553]
MTQPNTPAHRLDALNALEKADFVKLLGDIFEHSPEVAEIAWCARPFQSIEHLHETMMVSIRSRNVEARKTFLGRHPELSAAALRGGALTPASADEQASAGLHDLTPEDERQLEQLNRQYRARHGFPFIICVRHYTRAGLFFELRNRLGRDTATELDCALDQVHAITRNRLRQRLCH